MYPKSKYPNPNHALKQVLFEIWEQVDTSDTADTETLFNLAGGEADAINADAEETKVEANDEAETFLIELDADPLSF